MPTCIFPQRPVADLDPARPSPGERLLAPFTERQARLVLAMREWMIRGDQARRLIASWPSGTFSEAQAARVPRMLEMSVEALDETLFDETGAGPLRGRRMVGRDFAETQVRWYHEAEDAQAA